jgi:hypothetical protein
MAEHRVERRVKGVAVDEGVLGEGANSRRRDAGARARLLASTAGVLLAALAPGERVRWLARCCREVDPPSAAAGWAAVTVERTAVVVTDRRVVLLQLDEAGKPGRRRDQIALERIGSILSAPWRRCRLRLCDGSAVSLVGIPSEDRRRLLALVPDRRGGEGGRGLEPLAVLGSPDREVA